MTDCNDSDPCLSAHLDSARTDPVRQTLREVTRDPVSLTAAPLSDKLSQKKPTSVDPLASEDSGESSKVPTSQTGA